MIQPVHPDNSAGGDIRLSHQARDGVLMNMQMPGRLELSAAS